LMPTEEHEGIDLFKKEVSDGNYMMMPNDIFDRIRLEDNFNRVFEACAEFPLVSKEDYDNCSLIRQYMNPEKFNELAKKTGNEFSSSLEKVTEFYDNNELVKAVNAYFFR
ncbi:MAG TPA: hypothetical protein VI790_00175, partial [Candidatus Nanoarchaeia archaeon]|nr:hypothetical protein [Candidatus Nanoarchaeia archaeon]